MASSLTDRLLKSGSIKGAGIVSTSKFFGPKDPIKTELPILNIAFSGHLDGGLIPGLTVVAGATKSFKTLITLYCMKAYLKKYPEGIAILYDSEFGITPEYLVGIGIDTDRVLHIPIQHVEELKFDIVDRLKNIEKGDRVFIMIDSIGNLASKKEVEDAEEGKSVADMSRAKAIKSLFRIVTPTFTIKEIPCLAINHIYMEQCLAGDTMIRTEFGHKPISEINVGERVWALKGLREVTATYGPDSLKGEDKRYMELTFSDGNTIRCTHDHKFLLADGSWKEAQHLNENDEMMETR